MPPHSPLAPARQRAQELASSGDMAGAVAMLEKAVALAQANLAEDDPEVLRTSRDLGAMLLRHDDPSRARRVLEQAYGAGLFRHGDADPLMLELSHGIGAAAEELGNKHEARKAFGRLLELGPAVLGVDHPAVRKAADYLGEQPAEPRTAPVSVPPVAPQPVPAHPVSSGQSSSGQSSSGQSSSGPALDEATALQPIITPRVPEQRQAPVQQEVQVPAPTPVPQQMHGYDRAPHQPVSASPDTPPAVAPPPLRFPPQHTAPPLPTTAPQQYAAPVLDRGVPAGESRAYRKGIGLFAAIAAGLASVIAVIALVFVLADRKDDGPATVPGDKTDTNVPTLAGDPPTDVRMSDLGDKIELTWTDPSGGTVSFMVTMGHPGELLTPAATLGPGQTTYAVNALNPKMEYCFTVVAVYRGNQFSPSPQLCTRRAATTPR